MLFLQSVKIFVLIAIGQVLLLFSACDAAFYKANAPNQWQAVGTIVYTIDSRLSSQAQVNIVSTLSYMTSLVPGLTFSTTGTATLAFLLENSRSFCEDETTQIGKSSSGLTNIFITESAGAWCGTRGWIMHLVLHALGFYHEHQRPERDGYIYINYQNSRLSAPSKQAFLDINYAADATIYGAYDWESVMHYDYQATAFPYKTTIVAMPAEFVSIKSYGHATSFFYSNISVLSVTDVIALRSLFPSATAATIPSGQCQNGGHWYNWCLCKPGYAGRTCSDVYCHHECRNGGTCGISIATGLPSCSCPDGYLGTYCEIAPYSIGNCSSCPWWSFCDTAQSKCICDPYPYGDANCSTVISNIIPTTPPLPTDATYSTTLPPSTSPAIVVPTQRPSCDPTNLPSPRPMTLTHNFAYLRIALTDINFITDYVDLSSWNAVVLQTFLTEALQLEYQAQSGGSFLSILLTNVLPGPTGCTVVDYLAKFGQPLTTQQLVGIVQATYQKGVLYCIATNQTSRIGAVMYVSSSNAVVKVDSPCAVYAAESSCLNGGTCAPSGNQPMCICQNNQFSGAFCEIPNRRDDPGWPTLQIALVTLGCSAGTK